MHESGTCIIKENGKSVSYGYDELHGLQAGKATMFGLIGLGVLGGICFYLYPRKVKTNPNTAGAPAVENNG